MQVVPGDGNAGFFTFDRCAASQPGLWGWAGAEKVNASLAAVSRDLDRKSGGSSKKIAACYKVCPNLPTFWSARSAAISRSSQLQLTSRAPQVADGIFLGCTTHPPDPADLEKAGVIATLAVGDGLDAIDKKMFMHSVAPFAD